MTAATGRTRRYGTDPRPTRAPKPRRRRGRRTPASAAIACSGAGLLDTEFRVPGRQLPLVQREGDVVACHLGGLLDRHLVREDPREHRPEDVAILHVDPVLRGRDEPAPPCRAL